MASGVIGVSGRTMDVYCDDAQPKSGLHRRRYETKSDTGTAAGLLGGCHAVKSKTIPAYPRPAP